MFYIYNIYIYIYISYIYILYIYIYIIVANIMKSKERKKLVSFFSYKETRMMQ